MKVPVLPPRIPIYINNGYGRDTYISFYNGGFGSYKYSKSYKKDIYDVPIHRNHPDLFKRRPIDRYQISGEGRDYFIYKGIQTEHDRVSDNNSFENVLRKNGSPSQYKTSTERPINKFEKKLVNRIFYGKSLDVKDRQMSPKVKFKKDIEKEREEKEEENKLNNTISLRNTFLKTSKINETTNIFKKNNDKMNLLFTPINKNRKKILKLNNIDKDEDLINSVRKIFLYNSRHRVDAEQSKDIKV